MKIAFVMNPYDTSDISYEYGIGHFISKNLEAAGISIEYTGIFPEPLPLFFKGKQFLYELILKKKYFRHREPYILKHIAKKTSLAISNDIDVILCYGSFAAAYLESDKPIVYWADSTFAALNKFYPEYDNLANETIRKAEEIERLALSRCKMVFFSSEWAAKTAVDYYGTDPSKLKVVPFGPLIEENRTESHIENYIKDRPADKCRLLFISQNWERKGGDIALEIVKGLNQRNINAELLAIGTEPNIPENCKKIVTTYGFVDKSTEKGKKTFDELFSGSHFLLLPTKADCSPHSLNEANSYGVPCITTDVGGIPSIIRNGINGQMFFLSDNADKYVDYISSMMTDYEKYRNLAISSFKEYKERLNWGSSCKIIKSCFENILS